MRKKDFIGKAINDEILNQEEVQYYEPGSFGENPVVEMCLTEFEIDGWTDKRGYTHYSIRIHLYEDEARIRAINRIGHCHMCGGRAPMTLFGAFPTAAWKTKPGPYWKNWFQWSDYCLGRPMAEFSIHH